MKLIKPILIQCNHCAEIIEVVTDFELIAYDERQMGPEAEFEGLIEDNCPKCYSPLYIRISAWEYPIGMLNYSNTEIDGAELLEEPEISTFEY